MFLRSSTTTWFYMNCKKVVNCLLILFLSLFSNDLCSQNQSKESLAIPFSNGEVLNYIVSYKIGILNFDIALATFTVADDIYKGEPVFKITATATTKKAYESFFKMKDIYSVWVDKKTLIPYYYTNTNHENDYRFSSEFLYDWKNRQVTTISNSNKWDNSKTNTFALTQESFDPLSLFFRLRSLPIEKYTKSKKESLELVFYDKVRNVRYRYEGVSLDRVRGHGKLSLHKFVCELANLDGQSFKDGSEFELWISDDEKKIPVYLYSPIRIGSVRARLATKEELMRYYGN